MKKKISYIFGVLVAIGVIGAIIGAVQLYQELQ